MLDYLYRELSYEAFLIDDDDVMDPEDYGTYSKFSQKEFFPAITDDQWKKDKNFKKRENGYVFVPTACGTSAKMCRVHFHFHGCGEKPKNFGKKRSFNGLGALNDIIMVYPDTRCWDNSPRGKSRIDPDYFDTNHGILPTAFKSMVARVTTSESNEETDFEAWLGEQTISSNDEDCVAKFHTSVVEGS
jgi:hypothetical protein